MVRNRVRLMVRARLRVRLRDRLSWVRNMFCSSMETCMFQTAK